MSAPAPVTAAAARRPTWWRPSWAMPGGFFCGWRVECSGGFPGFWRGVPHGFPRRLCVASDLTQLAERSR